MVPGFLFGCARCAGVPCGCSSRPLSGCLCVSGFWFWFVVVVSSCRRCRRCCRCCCWLVLALVVGFGSCWSCWRLAWAGRWRARLGRRRVGCGLVLVWFVVVVVVVVGCSVVPASRLPPRLLRLAANPLPSFLPLLPLFFFLFCLPAAASLSLASLPLFPVPPFMFLLEQLSSMIECI